VFMPPALCFTSLAFITFSDFIEHLWNTNLGIKPG
jgi:hypothetical protein